MSNLNGIKELEILKNETRQAADRAFALWQTTLQRNFFATMTKDHGGIPPLFLELVEARGFDRVGLVERADSEYIYFLDKEDNRQIIGEAFAEEFGTMLVKSLNKGVSTEDAKEVFDYIESFFGALNLGGEGFMDVDPF